MRNDFNSIKEKKRVEKFRLKKYGLRSHLSTLKLNAKRKGIDFFLYVDLTPYSRKPITISSNNKPKLPTNIRYFTTLPHLFSIKNDFPTDGYLEVPECFSLIDNYEASFTFLKKLFFVLIKDKAKKVIIDYAKCERIDVDASICMDILLADFISYHKKCSNISSFKWTIETIEPTNYKKDNIIKVLFSIGAFKNIKGFKINFSDVEVLPVLINDNTKPYVWEKSEIDQTKIVEYIKSCLSRAGRELEIESETSFYKVIGEIMSNAEEHSTMPFRFAIGHFQEIEHEKEKCGIFNFSIFNFGDTIYQSFKNSNCKNQNVVTQMKALSESYTNKGWFKKALFEEETLWTLYALQEGVTSKEKKRGNGSIQYIENFFKLKGDLSFDNTSKLVIMSGNTRILFDGSYEIFTKQKENSNATFRMITFNDSKSISDVPDSNYVSFTPNYFPGTIISSRILLKFANTNISE